MTYRILIAEDHALLRDGLCAMLSQQPEFQVVGEVSDGKEAILAAVNLKPDAILINLALPGVGGLEATAQIRRRSPAIRVVGLSMMKSDEFVRAALRAGVDGYVLDDAPFEELLLAFRSVLAGKKFLSPAVSSQMAESIVNGASEKNHRSPWETLTARERSILRLIAEGHTNRMAAEYLNVSPKTVEKHRANLMRKLHLRNAAELLLIAIEAGLVERPDLARGLIRPESKAPIDYKEAVSIA